MKCECGKPAVTTRKIRKAGVDKNNKFITFTEVLHLCAFCATCHDENELEARYS